jgi:polyisoprenoid-binding protein YceI
MSDKTSVAESTIQKEIWTLDPTHSKIQFTARHLIISEVQGHFNSFDLKLTADDDFDDSEIKVTIDAKSIDTGVTDRDNHLRSADFFDVESYPEIHFAGKKIEKVNDEKFKLFGDLTIKNITKPIELDVTYGGTIKDPWGKTRAGFKIQGSLNRFDYELKWNALMETGGAIVGKTINLVCDVEVVK